MNRRVDVFIKSAKHWQGEFKALRELALASGLTEDLKWGHPCYTLDGANVILIHGFKEYCAILFMNGAIMKDPKKLLIQQTKNVQAGRQLRFKNLAEITKKKAVVKSYIKEAIALEEAGIKVPIKKAADFVVPAEITAKFKKHAGLAVAFKKLTPGRQRAYVLHFSAAKQEKTQDARIAKCAPEILKGKGLND
jgi:uncharacterized protein YdeI (YjbR/CyaY-like superfamily)